MHATQETRDLCLLSFQKGGPGGPKDIILVQHSRAKIKFRTHAESTYLSICMRMEINQPMAHMQYRLFAHAHMQRRPGRPIEHPSLQILLLIRRGCIGPRNRRHRRVLLDLRIRCWFLGMARKVNRPGTGYMQCTRVSQQIYDRVVCRLSE